MTAILQFLAPYQPYILFVHIISVMIWLWSASIAYTWILRPAWKEWQANPNDPQIKARRDWIFENYDKGLEFEHGAMLVVYISGPLLFLLGDWQLQDAKWMFYKLLIAFLVFLPLEIIDCYLAHFHGNKQRIRESGQGEEKYEKYMRINWIFLQISAPIAVVGILASFYFAILKPAL